MRRGFMRSFAGLLGGTAFAVAVAGPAQWCPCPMHGVLLPPPASQLHAAAAAMPMPMPMPEANAGDAPAQAAAEHDARHSHHDAHRCTCPGCCCCTTPAVWRAPSAAQSPVARDLDVAERPAPPRDSAERAPSPQLALPFATAPPGRAGTLQDAAHYLT